MLDRFRNRTSATTETLSSSSSSVPHVVTVETTTKAVTSNKTQITDETSTKCSTTIDSSLNTVLNNILKAVKSNSDRLDSLEPKITRTLELATLISVQTSGIDEGFIRFNDHLSNLYEVIRVQSNLQVNLDGTLADNIEKLQILKRNATSHRSKIKSSTMNPSKEN